MAQWKRGLNTACPHFTYEAKPHRPALPAELLNLIRLKRRMHDKTKSAQCDPLLPQQYRELGNRVNRGVRDFNIDRDTERFCDGQN